LPGVPPPAASVAWQLFPWGLGMAYAGGAAPMTAMATRQLAENSLCFMLALRFRGARQGAPLYGNGGDGHLVHTYELAEKYLTATFLVFAFTAPLRRHAAHGTWRRSAAHTAFTNPCGVPATVRTRHIGPHSTFGKLEGNC